MLKPQDVLVVLKFASLSGAKLSSFADLGKSLSMSASEVFAATHRAALCRLLVKGAESAGGIARFRPFPSNLREFLISGLPYVFPVEPGKAVRGFCTAQDAPPLSTQLARPPGELPWVWPDPEGDTRGMAIKPLYRSVPVAARRDARLYAWLALADAVRAGAPRVRMLAATEISRLITILETDLDHVRTR